MQINKTTVTKLHLTELDKLDPISVFLEDLAPAKGKIIIECFGSSWAATWGSMGRGRNVATFFCGNDADYLIGSLAPHLRGEIFSGQALKALAEKTISERRDGTSDMDELPPDEADELLEEAGVLASCSSLESTPPELMDAIFGCEWWHPAGDATEPNPCYAQLREIVEAVQTGLKEAGLVIPKGL